MRGGAVRRGRSDSKPAAQRSRSASEYAAPAKEFLRKIVDGARAVPADYPRVKAWMQLVRFLNLCADAAEDQGLTIAIEPLNRAESNIINTYLEGVQLARDVDRRGVRVLADIYHMMQDDEPLEDLLQAPEWLAHVHLADTGRRHPGSGVYPLPELLALLREIDYRGAASIECRWGDDFAAEARFSAQFLTPLMA
mgnify:CR=1 FL=1